MTALTEAAAGPARPTGPAYRDPNVLRWLGAYTASTLGDSVYHLALSWAAVRGGTPAEAGLVMAVSAVPRALLMLGGGVIADRFGPRRVVVLSDTVRCIVVLGVAALLLLTSPALWVLAAVALVFGAVDALFLPAVGALPPRIVPRDQLARVQGMRGLAYRAGARPRCPARRPRRRPRRAGGRVRRRRAPLRVLPSAAPEAPDRPAARRRALR